jgi:hypothetical protein
MFDWIKMSHYNFAKNYTLETQQNHSATMVLANPHFKHTLWDYLDQQLICKLAQTLIKISAYV